MPHTASASGYSSKVNSPFNRPEVLELVSLKAEIQSITPLIAKAGILEAPQYVGQSIFLMHEPDGLMWKPYEANQAMVPDQATPTGECMIVEHSNYAAMKVDNSERKILGDNYSSFYEKVIDKTAEKLAPMYDKFVLGQQIFAAPPTMRGNRAGKYKSVNLGSIGNPLILNSKNVITFMSQLATLFENYGYGREERFLVAPFEFNTILANSPLASYCHVGEKFGILTDEYTAPANVLGFDVILNNSIEANLDPSKNEQIYYLVAGCSKATAFGGSVIEADEREMEDSFGTKYRFQEVHGGKVVEPDAISVIVVKFDFTV